MMKSKKEMAFTLIELLAVIVIIAIIALITTPVVLNVIDETRKEVYKTSSLNILKAAELYEANNNFSFIDENGIDISELDFENNRFKSGKVIRNDEDKLELINVTDGVYCSKGTKDNLIIIKGSCDQLDETAPTNIRIVTNYIRSNKFSVVIYGEDLESGIKQYHYSLDSVNYKISNFSTIEITGLESGKTYKIYVKVENNNGLISEVVEKEIVTEEIESPTYSIDKTGWAKEKVVTITYPERQPGYVYQYSIDNGSTWTIVENGTTVNVTFTSNGSVIARVHDGVNYNTASTYNVTQIDTTAPTEPIITGGGTTYATSRTITVSGVVENDSGIARYEYYAATSLTSPTASTTGTSNETATTKTFNINNAGNVGPWSSAQRLYIDINKSTISAKKNKLHYRPRR